MAENSRIFHIGDILSVTTGKLVSRRHIEGVYDILNFMTGDTLYTHQLPRAADECRPFLIEQHPALAEAEARGVDAETWSGWLDEQATRFGETLEVRPLPEHAHEFVDPLSEAAENVHPNRIIIAKANSHG